MMLLKMVFQKLLVFCCLFVFVMSGDKRRGNSRKSRFITFDSENNDIEVSLDFTVPFISIPLRKTVNTLLGGFPGLSIPKVNFNPSALAFASVMVVATSVLLPLFSKGFSSFHGDTDRYYRVLDAENPLVPSNIFMHFGNQILSMSRGCPLRIACWMSQSSSDGESRKTLENIIRNKLVTSVINTTAIEEAFKSGKNGYDCTSYEPCPIREESMTVLMKNFAVLTNSRNGS